MQGVIFTKIAGENSTESIAQRVCGICRREEVALKKVVGLVVGLLLCPVAVCAILALIVCAIAGDVPGKLLGAFTSCYVLFGGCQSRISCFCLPSEMTTQISCGRLAWGFIMGRWFPARFFTRFLEWGKRFLLQSDSLSPRCVV